MVGLSELTLNVRDALFHTRNRGQIRHSFFHILKFLPNNLQLGKLNMTIDLDWHSDAARLEGWPLSHFLDRRYTRRSKNTVIDLKNDYIILDIRLQGFDALPENLFPPERIVTCNCDPLTTGQIIEEVRCEKIKYPTKCWYMKSSVIPIVTIHDDFFELTIVDKMTKF